MNQNDIRILASHISSISDHFEQGKNKVENFVVEAMQWHNEMIRLIEKDKEKLKNSSKGKRCNIEFPKFFLHNNVPKSTVKRNKNHEMHCTITNSFELLEPTINDSIASRTRGALRETREQRLEEVSNRATRGRTRGTKRKEEFITDTDKKSNVDTFKKFKDENASIVELSEDSTQVFKKPPRRNRTKLTSTIADVATPRDDSIIIKNLDNQVIAEESQFFNYNFSALHSSPKLNHTQTKTLFPNSTKPSTVAQSSPKRPISIVTPGTPSVREKVAAFEKIGSINQSKINLPKEKTENVVTKVDSSAERRQSLRSSRTSKNQTPQRSLDSTMSPPTTGGEVVKESEDEEEFVGNVEVAPVNESPVVRLTRNRSKLGKSLNEALPEIAVKCSSPIVEMKAKETVVKVTKRIEETIVTTVLSPVVSLSSVAEDNVNSTVVVPKASKRTKPVAKSKIFDNLGNIMVPAESIVSSKESVPARTYSLRSSKSTTGEATFKIEPVEAEESESRVERSSNAENEPQEKRRKRTAKANPETVEDNSNVRTTRTKSKMAQSQNQKQSGLSLMARKSLKKAKKISVQTLLPKGQGQISILQSASKDQFLQSASKNQFLLSKLKTPLSTVPSNTMNSHSKGTGLRQMSGVKASASKGKYIYQASATKTMTNLEKLVRSATKPPPEDDLDKELKLKEMKEKEEGAILKREKALKNRQEELKKKNALKLESVKKQKEKIEMEKFHYIIQNEKQKEEKLNLLLQERKQQQKEQMLRKKMIQQQKLAENEERRRLEEEARIAKIKEQEAEQERAMLEKQREKELHEKRLQERLAEQKAQELYEQSLKQAQMKEKALTAMQSSSKPPKPVTKRELKIAKYKPRNENDLGLEDENSELESDEETVPAKGDKETIPEWARMVMDKACPTILMRKELISSFMSMQSKTPDISKMFKITPRKIKRSSSAIWNTPST